MSSGSYVPPPVKAVAIPKKTGGERILGVPTVADRVAQMVVKQVLEPNLEPIFLPNSYGYRPGKSALDAIAVTRERCWRSIRLSSSTSRACSTISTTRCFCGAGETYGVQMGAALYRTLADSAASTQRRNLGGTDQGNAARRRGELRPGQSLSALRVRRLDDTDVSGRAVVSVRRRWADTLRNRNAGACHSGGACRSARSVRLGDPPRQDAYCLCKDEVAEERHPNPKFDFLGYTFGRGREKSQTEFSVRGFTPAVSAKALKAMRRPCDG